MTEQQWLAATDPGPMLASLRDAGHHRKLRLFAVACCRRLWNLLDNEAHRRAVELAERLADGPAGDAERESAREALRLTPSGTDPYGLLVSLLHEDAGRAADDVPWKAVAVAARAGWEATGAEWHLLTAAERAAQAVLLRCVLGNVFCPVPLNPHWLTADVLSLARAAYEHRTLPSGTLERERLGLLADALEDAGSDNAEILAHLRGPGPHVRGCWSIDLILRRE
jgi:hypothetical protein